MTRRTVGRLLTSLAALALCAELAGVAAYYIDTGRLFYTHRKTYQELLATPEDRLVVGEAVHPYFGFTQVTPSVAPREGAPLFTDIAATWTSASMLMNEPLAARGAAYVHVLQPNQYHTTRTFSESEAATALSDASPYKKSVEAGYPVLVATAEKRLAGKVRFLDATRVFDREPAPVYMDNCCHYTLAGNHVLADFVAASILATPGPWKP